MQLIHTINTPSSESGRLFPSSTELTKVTADKLAQWVLQQAGNLGGLPQPGGQRVFQNCGNPSGERPADQFGGGPHSAVANIHLGLVDSVKVLETKDVVARAQRRPGTAYGPAACQAPAGTRGAQPEGGNRIAGNPPTDNAEDGRLREVVPRVQGDVQRDSSEALAPARFGDLTGACKGFEEYLPLAALGFPSFGLEEPLEHTGVLLRFARGGARATHGGFRGVAMPRRRHSAKLVSTNWP